MTDEERQFLADYDPGKYPRPSVTADIVILRPGPDDRLMVLMVQRRDWPHKGQWALPGGFLNAGQESAEQAAARELQEETGLAGLPLRQLATFSEPDRDPRTHVVSVAYTALVPKGAPLKVHAADDAAMAMWFDVYFSDDALVLKSTFCTLTERDVAFDHANIIKTAIGRLRGRIAYRPDAFELLQDKSSFTIYELKRIYQAILEKHLDSANFRRMFMRTYFKTGLVDATGKFRECTGHRPAALYRVTEELRTED